MTRRQAAGLALVFAGLLSISLSAQRITRRVFVTAMSGGTPVLDLTAADFQIVENGTKREVTRAALGNEPMRVVLLVDSSTAVGQMLTHIRAALTTFFDTLPPEHEVAFITHRRPDSGFAPSRPPIAANSRPRPAGSRRMAAGTRSSRRCSSRIGASSGRRHGR